MLDRLIGFAVGWSVGRLAGWLFSGWQLHGILGDQNGASDAGGLPGRVVRDGLQVAHGGKEVGMNGMMMS